MNDFEFDTIQRISSLENVKWWHRVTDRKGFCINGYVNHYPDFLIMTKKGMLVAVETKGNHLADEKTLDKLSLGRIWQLYKWRTGTIRNILSNEKYCGDALMQKTYTKNFLTHKSVKNKNFFPMYFTKIITMQ